MHRALAVVLSTLIATAGASLATPSPASAGDSPGGRLVGEQPASGTPHVLDGRVLSIAEVRDTIVLGGTFTTARNDADQGQLTRMRLLAFDENTGQISESFRPEVNGTVTTVLPAGDGESVYVAGSFTSVGGVARDSVARVRVSDGAVVSSFDAGSVTGQVKDLRLARGRLWLAGAFTHVGGRAQRALATVDPLSGAFDPYVRLAVDGVHNGGYTTVAKIDVSPDSSRLVAVGNFDTLQGVRNHQLFMLDLSGSTAAPAAFITRFYESACSSSFNSYMRGLDFAPDGSYFVVTTTGAYGGSNSACDASARFEADAEGSNVRPSWVDYTGGDTTYAVEVTESAVYTGGHARWQNNPFAGDRAGPGAVSRPGIAALDPSNGLPFSWNPTRTLGVGVFDFLVTERGLWVGSDTERIGSYIYKGRIALLPLAGKVIPAVATPALPGDVYVAGTTGAASDPRVLYRVNAGGPQLSAPAGIDWAADTAEAPSQFHNGVGNRATWSPVGSTGPEVPAGTPDDVFASELWDPLDATEQAWDFPVPAGTPLQVRLYFADRCSCTSLPGQRVFDVYVDDELTIDDLDVNAAVGHDAGTVRSFDLTSDGNVDVDLGHVVENPMISGVEVLRTDLSAPTGSSIVRRAYDGVEPGPAVDVPPGALDWDQVRGAFMLDGSLYVAEADGSFTRRAFDGTTYGEPVPVAVQDELTPLSDWHDDIRAATGMFFDSGRIYFTRSGAGQLYYRYFTPESDVVGAKRFVAASDLPGIDFSQVRGMFTTGEELYWAEPDGSLRRAAWSQGDQSDVPVPGTATVVSGPGIDSVNWAARVLFLYQGLDEPDPTPPPVADFSWSCAGTSCEFEARGSSAPGATITSYSWDFGDGTSGAGGTVGHTYSSPGTFEVALTIVTDHAGTAETSRTVQVTGVDPQATVQYVGAAATAGNRVNHRVTVPAQIEPGDALLLFLTTNSSSTGIDSLPGWTLLQSADGSGVRGRAWSRTATAADAGSVVTVSTEAYTKSVLAVAAYRGSAASDAAVIASAGAVHDTLTTAHPTPAVPVSESGSWVVSWWSEKSTGERVWLPPSGVEPRTSASGNGGGKVSALMGDSDGPVPLGDTAVRSAETTAETRRVVVFSAVISVRPAG